MLHLAAKEEAGDSLEWLLEQGANPGLVDRSAPRLLLLLLVLLLLLSLTYFTFRKGNLALHIAINTVISNYR